jgi:hypothetical protein
LIKKNLVASNGIFSRVTALGKFFENQNEHV